MNYFTNRIQISIIFQIVKYHTRENFWQSNTTSFFMSVVRHLCRNIDDKSENPDKIFSQFCERRQFKPVAEILCGVADRIYCILLPSPCEHVTLYHCLHYQTNCPPLGNFLITTYLTHKNAEVSHYSHPFCILKLIKEN